MRSGFSVLKWDKEISNLPTCLVHQDDELLLLTLSPLDEVGDRPALPAVHVLILTAGTIIKKNGQIIYIGKC